MDMNNPIAFDSHCGDGGCLPVSLTSSMNYSALKLLRLRLRIKIRLKYNDKEKTSSVQRQLVSFS